MSRRLVIGVRVLIASGRAVGVARAEGSCAASCVPRTAARRAERCPAATGKNRWHCRDVCRAVTGCAAGAARSRTLAAVVSECRTAVCHQFGLAGAETAAVGLNTLDSRHF